MSAALAQPGHNMPPIDLDAALEPHALKAWLDGQFLPHVTRRDELMTSYARFLTATQEGIQDEKIAAKATDFARQFKAAIKETDDTRTRIKAPVLSAQRSIDGAAKAISDNLSAACRTIESRITAYLVEKERKVREAAEAEAAAREAEAQRLLATAQQSHDAVAQEAAEQALEVADKAIAVAEARPAELTRTHTELGGVTSLRRIWTYEVVDLSKVPAAYLQINDAVVKAALKTAPKQGDGKPLIDIPGIRIVAENKATIR